MPLGENHRRLLLLCELVTDVRGMARAIPRRILKIGSAKPEVYREKSKALREAEVAIVEAIATQELWKLSPEQIDMLFPAFVNRFVSDQPRVRAY